MLPQTAATITAKRMGTLMVHTAITTRAHRIYEGPKIIAQSDIPPKPYTRSSHRQWWSSSVAPRRIPDPVLSQLFQEWNNLRSQLGYRTRNMDHGSRITKFVSREPRHGQRPPRTYLDPNNLEKRTTSGPEISLTPLK